jgi:hypothetical protein
MKVSEILIGHKYTDGKGNIREVSGEYLNEVPGVFNRQCVSFEVVEKKSSSLPLGYRGSMTKKRFAAWAKKDITVGTVIVIPHDLGAIPISSALRQSNLFEEEEVEIGDVFLIVLDEGEKEYLIPSKQYRDYDSATLAIGEKSMEFPHHESWGRIRDKSGRTLLKIPARIRDEETGKWIGYCPLPFLLK